MEMKTHLPPEEETVPALATFFLPATSQNDDTCSNTECRRNSTTISKRRRSSATRISQEILHHICLYPVLNGEKVIKLDELSPNEAAAFQALPAEELDLTVPTKIWPQVFAAISVSLASMLIGLCTAYTSPAIASMAQENSSLKIDPDGPEASWIGSLMPLGALVGGIVGGTLLELVGRKRTIILTGPPFLISWLMMALASSMIYIYCARALAGLSIGIAGLCLPVYLAETVQPEVRGTLGLLPTTVGNTGILIAYFGGSYLNWRELAFVGGGLCFPYIICMLLIPETPRWYISHGQDEEGAKALEWFRGKGADISTELTQIKHTHILSKKYSTKFKDIFTSTYAKPLIIALGLMFFQQLSGINAVIFYSKTIFTGTGSKISDDLSTVIIGSVNIVATIISTLLIDRVGRKVLLLGSDIIMILSLATLGTFFYLKEYHTKIVEDLGWIALLSLILFVIGFSLGFGPIPWLMMGEIFPTRIRATAAAITTAFNWFCTFAVTKAFPQVVATFGTSTAFYIFGIVCMFGIIFIIFYVPETRGESLEEIEKNLTRPFRRVSSAAHMKPLPLAI